MRLTSLVILIAFFLSSCKTTQSLMDFGPKTSNQILEKEKVQDFADDSRPRLDVAIAAFDPNIPKSKNEDVWKELRKAESIRFAYKLKLHIEKLDKFGAVRVVPDLNATSDLYISGKIMESNSEEVELDIKVADISGNLWIDDDFEHQVPEDFYTKGGYNQDSYDPVFQKIAKKIEEKLQFVSTKNLDDLKYISDLRFGMNLSEESFSENIDKNENGKYIIKAKFDSSDPKYIRLSNLRVRDQLFIDELQVFYMNFNENIDTSYLTWQQQTFQEKQAESKAKGEAVGKAIGGILLLGAAVLAAVAGANSGDAGGQALGTIGAVGGGMAGASLLQDSFKKSAEAKVHRDAIDELGQSLDVEMSSKVVELNNDTVELTGTAKEQFSQWRLFLKKIYEKEKTPEVEIPATI